MKLSRRYSFLSSFSTVLPLLCLLSIAGTQADQITGSMTVTATVVDGCAVGNLVTSGGFNDFGSVDFGQHANLSQNTDAQGGGSTGVGFQLTCSSGLSYQIGLNDGQHASGGSRRMTDGNNNYIPYQLYRDNARTQLWGDAGTANELTTSGTGASQFHLVYGRINATTTPPAGNYSDTIQVTLVW
ncbi:spore coat U domain-containing protein [Rheinheimera texasensis]|uniref:Csu type fimbrial protein n=1 Tax=Rheinheimera texasensis TaxID=306205 RepID=UPI0032B29C8A